MSGFFDDILFRIIHFLPGILIGLTVHEYCHAFAAFKLGDSTARDMGRLTFNPIKHIDPIGFLFLIFAGFGWAKRVQFYPGNLRNPRRDKAIIAAAGPLSNLVLALFFTGIIRIWFFFLARSFYSGNEELLTLLQSPVFDTFINLTFYATMINLGLFVFNLLPIPPLDGSHIVFSSLNLRPETEYRIMRIGAPLLIIIIVAQNMLDITILPILPFIEWMLGLLMPF